MQHARAEVPARSTWPSESWKLRNVGNKTFQFIPFDQQKQEPDMAGPHELPAETAGKAAIGCRPGRHWHGRTQL